MNLLENPNLPDTDVALVAMSGTYPELVKSLNILGIDVITVGSCTNLGRAIRDHADMIIHHLGSKKIVIQKSQKELISAFINKGFDVIPSYRVAGNGYPNDVILNAARVGNYLFAKSSVLDESIGNYCEKNNVKIIDENQGYAKCSTVVVDENSIITADPSIAEAAGKIGMDVLAIESGYVGLKGYDYGFLGGACGKISKDIIAFTGKIELHPDYERIKIFCSDRNIKIISLSESPLIDVGGIIPLAQN
jgi:hypothetical protein